MADAGISRERPWVTERRRPERICSYMTLRLMESTTIASTIL